MGKNIIEKLEIYSQQMKLFYSANEIEKAIKNIAIDMNIKLADKNPLFLCVMNGAVVFLGNLILKLKFYLQLDYIHVSRYRGEQKPHEREVTLINEPFNILKDRNVVIVEDIFDKGVTMSIIKDYCQRQQAKRIYTASLVVKKCKREERIITKLDFSGFEIEDRFIVGYGMDYKGYFRNLKNIYTMD